MSEDAITNLQRRVTFLEHRQRPRLESGDPYRVTWLEQRIGILEGRIAGLEGQRDKQAFDEHAVKSQAAQQQATKGLYAPLRSDTKPLLEMAAFVRKIADYGLFPFGVNQRWVEIVTEAREILKRST
jgi:hypothetical protein